MPTIDVRGLTKTVAGLVKNLSVRNRDIVSRRFGLKNGQRETLESIGKGYGITRERVRQIEEFSLAQLSKTIGDNRDVVRFTAATAAVIGREGGVIKEEHLFRTCTGSERESAANAALAFLLNLDKDLERTSENDRFHAFWSVNTTVTAGFRDMTVSLADSLAKHGSVAVPEKVVALANEHGVKVPGAASFSDRHLALATSISKDFGSNIYGQVGLASWSEIHPKGVRDKAYLVMKKEGKPCHFSGIAKLINGAKFDAKKVNVQTVHNELIKDERFVLVGRGMYALAEWGYKSGTVKDVLVDILRGHGKPLLKADLISKVKDARLVKENTILLNLQDSGTFVKDPDGTYHLRKK